MSIRFSGAMILLALLPIHSPAQSAASATAVPDTPATVAANPAAVAPDPAAAAPRFAVADVHPSPPMWEAWFDGPHIEGDRYVINQATMIDLISEVYGFDDDHVQGGPSGLDLNRYDIVAKIEPTTPKQQQKLMLKALLADRFHLVVHDGTAPLPAYVLKIAKDKPKLKPSDGSGDAHCDRQPNPPDSPPQIFFSCHNQTMEKLAELLDDNNGGGYLDKTVVDETGLKGSFDFDLKWTPRRGRDRAGAASISIFDAIDSQLGLKLVLETAPRPVLIVDHADDSPTPNAAGIEKLLPPLPLPEFEVAAIRPSKPGEDDDASMGNGRLNVKGMTLRDMITMAWDLNDDNKHVIINEPSWLDTNHWDILAKMSTDEASELANKPPDADFRTLQLMMGALLDDRFGLKAHMEERPGIAYDLVADHPKLTPADPKSRTRCTDGPGPDGKDPRITNPILNHLVTCQNMTMAELGEQLQEIADGYIFSPVLDKTGLEGSYDFTLSFSSPNRILGAHIPSSARSASQGSESAAPDPNGAVSIFDALRRELGLKLEKVKRPVPVLVIDHIEENPTPN